MVGREISTVVKKEIAQAAQERLEERVKQFEAVIQDWAVDEDDNWWTDERTGSD